MAEAKDKKAKVKVRVGVVHSGKELELEVDLDAKKLSDEVIKKLSDGERVLTFETGDSRTIIPIDKVTYVEVSDSKKAGTIGFGGS